MCGNKQHWRLDPLDGRVDAKLHWTKRAVFKVKAVFISGITAATCLVLSVHPLLIARDNTFQAS